MKPLAIDKKIKGAENLSDNIRDILTQMIFADENGYSDLAKCKFTAQYETIDHEFITAAYTTLVHKHHADNSKTIAGWIFDGLEDWLDYKGINEVVASLDGDRIVVEDRYDEDIDDVFCYRMIFSDFTVI